VEDNGSHQPHLFATRDGMVSLMLYTTREGGLLFQFWDLDVVSYHMRVIGRVVIANEEHENSSKFLVPVGSHTHPQTGLNFERRVDVCIDIRTLEVMMKEQSNKLYSLM
jgi:hypothetical protein